MLIYRLEDTDSLSPITSLNFTVSELYLTEICPKDKSAVLEAKERTMQRSKQHRKGRRRRQGRRKNLHNFSPGGNSGGYRYGSSFCRVSAEIEAATEEIYGVCCCQ